MSHIHDTLHEMTGGRPYVFVIMSYRKEREALFGFISSILKTQFNVNCIRADQILNAGHDLLAKLHELIRRADLVIAEITEPEPGKPSPNVFYEIGYAAGIGRHPLLLLECGRTVPTDLQGLEVIEYRNTFDGFENFKEMLAAHLRTRLISNVLELRDMLEAPDPTPSYIVTSPRRAREGQFIEAARTLRTFGDRLGILGLIRAFGSIVHESGEVELVSQRHSAKKLLGCKANLYFIGSRKVNEPAGKVLEKVQGEHYPRWSFDPDSNHPPHDAESEMDRLFALYRHDDKDTRYPLLGTRGKQQKSGNEVWTQDYGLIVRAPHPEHPNRMVLLLAGAHSLGTGAACLAATRSSLIKQIRTRFGESAATNPMDQDSVLANKKSAFWVLVKGVVNAPDYLLDEEGVTIEDVGVYTTV